ncbi:AAA family ATPase [Caballeronia glebae]|uniref:AAA family ATPase n=1 Tax=Caballeronia glebae TaxID=1777143 RepID=UPI0038BC380C
MTAGLAPEERQKKEEEALRALEARKTQLDADRATLDARVKALEEKEAAATAKDLDLARRERDLATGEAASSEKRAELARRESAIEVRELDARNGFAEQHEPALRGLKAQIQALEQRRTSLILEIEEEKAQARETLTKEIDAMRQRLSEREAQLVEAQSTLEVQQEELKLGRLALKTEKRTRDEMEGMLRRHLENEFAAERMERERSIEKLHSRSADLARELSAAREELESQAGLLDVLNGRAPSALLQELETLRQGNRRLERTVSDLRAFEAADELGIVRTERDQAREELEGMRIEIEGYRQQAFVTKISVLERENSARELRVLQQKNLVLTTHLDELETRIGKLTDSRHAASAFPELSRMDNEPEFQAERAVDEVRDLKTFTNELQTRLAWAHPDEPLHFDLSDLQLFVGGLAMSQLHVFQGISGTGKTSLAKAFAEVVGGECQDIAVQAGWRDRSDLLGHYNTFEKRFAEKECLQALYRASTPSARNRVNIILLDEMNLSRPEQYFADFLSVLEKKRDRTIRLIESSEPNAPRALIGGRDIALPDNVWFIGTANQDETTNELADKTHDRAFVLELPRNEGHIERGPEPRKTVYSFESLMTAFRAAHTLYRAEVDDILTGIRGSDLTRELGERFGIGWGNRFERQARHFLPVVKASGGSLAQALDHLLSTRVFRNGKVVGRYDIAREDLEQVRIAVEDMFGMLEGGAEPVRCRAAIERDIKRLERGA